MEAQNVFKGRIVTAERNIQSILSICGLPILHILIDTHTHTHLACYICSHRVPCLAYSILLHPHQRNTWSALDVSGSGILYGPPLRFRLLPCSYCWARRCRLECECVWLYMCRPSWCVCSMCVHVDVCALSLLVVNIRSASLTQGKTIIVIHKHIFTFHCCQVFVS